jgi:hypothetical protein
LARRFRLRSSTIVSKEAAVLARRIRARSASVIAFGQFHSIIAVLGRGLLNGAWTRSAKIWLAEFCYPDLLSSRSLAPVSIAASLKESAYARAREFAILIHIQHPGGLRNGVFEVPQKVPCRIADSYHQERDAVPFSQEHAVGVKSSSVLQSHQSDCADSRQLTGGCPNHKDSFATAAFCISALDARFLGAPKGEDFSALLFSGAEIDIFQQIIPEAKIELRHRFSSGGAHFVFPSYAFEPAAVTVETVFYGKNGCGPVPVSR